MDLGLKIQVVIPNSISTLIEFAFFFFFLVNSLSLQAALLCSSVLCARRRGAGSTAAQLAAPSPVGQQHAPHCSGSHGKVLKISTTVLRQPKFSLIPKSVRKPSAFGDLQNTN